MVQVADNNYNIQELQDRGMLMKNEEEFLREFAESQYHFSKNPFWAVESSTTDTMYMTVAQVQPWVIS